MNIIPLRIALAQVNMTVGDLDGNTQKIISYMQQAHAAGAHLVCFPELALTGYPPEDLLLKPGFITAQLRKLDEIIQASTQLPGLTAVIGFVDRDHDIYNAAAVVYEGRLSVPIINTISPTTASSTSIVTSAKATRLQFS